MRYFNNIEESKKAMQEHINNTEILIHKLPALLEVCKNFQGKVYNCRFEKAVKELSGENITFQVKTDKNFGIFRIIAYFRGTYENMVDRYVFSTHQNEHLINNRINYEWFLSQYDRALEELSDDLKCEQATLEKAENLINEYNAKINDLEDFGKKLHYNFGQYFGCHLDTLIYGNLKR